MMKCDRFERPASFASMAGASTSPSWPASTAAGSKATGSDEEHAKQQHEKMPNSPPRPIRVNGCGRPDRSGNMDELSHVSNRLSKRKWRDGSCTS